MDLTKLQILGDELGRQNSLRHVLTVHVKA